MVLLECKKLENDHAGDKWSIGDPKGLSADDFWTWAKSDGLVYDRDSYRIMYNFVKFEKEIWFKLVKDMWRKHRSIFQDYLKYIRNNIVKPFCVRICCYAYRVQDMYDLAKNLPPPSMKGNGYKSANWKVCNK